jgi:hypothetical protein
MFKAFIHQYEIRQVGCLGIGTLGRIFRKLANEISFAWAIEKKADRVPVRAIQLGVCGMGII